MKRDLLSLRDWTQQELLDCLSLAAELKAAGPMGSYSKALAGRSYALIFHKNSLRTRVSFEVGISQLGGSSMYLTDQDFKLCLLYTSPSPRDATLSRMPSSA